MSKCLCDREDILSVTHDYRIRKHFHVSVLWSIKSTLRHKDKSKIWDKINYVILLKEKKCPFFVFESLIFKGCFSCISTACIIYRCRLTVQFFFVLHKTYVLEESCWFLSEQITTYHQSQGRAPTTWMMGKIITMPATRNEVQTPLPVAM